MKTNKTVLPPVVKQEFAKRPNHNNNNIPSHLDVPKKLPSAGPGPCAKKSPPPQIKSEIKLEGKCDVTIFFFLNYLMKQKCWSNGIVHRVGRKILKSPG